MATVHTEHVPRLLDSAEDDAVLVLHEGRVDVVPESALAEPRYRGALRVAGREDLGLPRGSDRLSEEDAGAVANRLSTVVDNLGG